MSLTEVNHPGQSFQLLANSKATSATLFLLMNRSAFVLSYYGGSYN